jgi:hypothetical protein
MATLSDYKWVILSKFAMANLVVVLDSVLYLNFIPSASLCEHLKDCMKHCSRFLFFYSLNTFSIVIKNWVLAQKGNLRILKHIICSCTCGFQCDRLKKYLVHGSKFIHRQICAHQCAFPKIKKVHKLGDNSSKDPQIFLATIQNVVPRLSSAQDLCIPDTGSEVVTYVCVKHAQM